MMYHSIGAFPGKHSAIARQYDEFARAWGSCEDQHWDVALGMRSEFLRRWARIINASPGTVTTAENVTAAFCSLLGALPRAYLHGRRLLVGQDCFPSLHFLLAGLTERFGFELVTVPLRPGENWVRDEDFIDRWDPSVGLALLTFVSSTSSHRVDLARLVAHGRAQGSLICADITQGVGLVPFDCRSPRVDFTISTSLKWLCGVPGGGILQVDEPMLEQCRPELRGWFSQPDPFSWALDRFEFAPDARRFDNGTPSVMGAVGSLPGLRWFAEQDGDALRRHNQSLCEQLIAGLQAIGVELACPVDASRRGGTVMARLPEHARPDAVRAALRAQGVFIDTRGQIMRMSPGVVTRSDGVERLLTTLQAMLSPAGRP